MKTRNTDTLIIVALTLIVSVFTAGCRSLTLQFNGKYYSNDPVPVGGVSVDVQSNGFTEWLRDD